ncbi:MAG TPA: FAD-dependent oxidoreductase [Candidatus Limnocylindria bacterium]|nr:FAD-dependent oxidoreductase [Candidatus Limnocylindria bacterium]
MTEAALQERGVGWWMREALAAEPPVAAAPPLADMATTTFDVAIVGAGYTGLWTAWSLLQGMPGARVVVLEQGLGGGAASGRNGGFVHGWWDQMPYLVEQFGTEAALRVAGLVDESVQGIGDWCAKHGVDAWFRRGGYLRVSASPAQDGEWRPAVEACRAAGEPDAYVELSADEVRARCASPVMRGGALMANAATVQPARLARALRHAVQAAGARVVEGTRVEAIRPGEQLTLQTSVGPIRAEQAVLAINAWGAGWPGFRTRLLSWGSHIVLTEPAPERLAEIGWTGGEAIADGRFTVHYFRTTPDGRVAFGAGVGAAGFGGRVDGRYDRDGRAEGRARAALARFLPSMADVPIADAWGGAIDISPDRLPLIGSAMGGRLHYAHGFSGNGVGPAHFAGRVLSALVDSPGSELATLPIVNRSVRPFPPEPLRFAGARIIREALVRRDEAQDAGRPGSLAVRMVAGIPRLMGYRFGAPKHASGATRKSD